MASWRSSPDPGQAGRARSALAVLLRVRTAGGRGATSSPLAMPGPSQRFASRRAQRGATQRRPPTGMRRLQAVQTKAGRRGPIAKSLLFQSTRVQFSPPHTHPRHSLRSGGCWHRVSRCGRRHLSHCIRCRPNRQPTASCREAPSRRSRAECLNSARRENPACFPRPCVWSIYALGNGACGRRTRPPVRYTRGRGRRHSSVLPILSSDDEETS
jgi:hypothetical protein